ncbi:hypothetical protein [Flavobacterium aestuarii]|uniref:hypothetical protein n=1 Tax=Flavobacterium aestuarii TaxID=3149227 RepID=UPI0032B32AFF
MLVSTGKKTIDNLQGVSEDILDSQNQANVTYKTLKETYAKTIENLEKSERNYKTNLENLERTLDAKNSILESQKDMISRLTGGDSYPYFTISNKKLKLNINGKYNIPNLHFEIYFLKDYLIQEPNNLKKYLFQGILNTNIIKLKENTISKLFVNQYNNGLELSDEVLQHIRDDQYSGIDIKFTSEFKKWSQTIRLNKNILDQNTLEICNVIYELKETKSDNPFELAKRIKAEASINFNLPFKLIKEIYKMPINDDLIILYPKIDILELKSNEIEKNLSNYSVDEFK